jgi:Na+/H+-dicarboxylate symporter
MAWLTAVTGFKALVPLAKYILATIIGVTFQSFVVVAIFVALIARVNPWHFYKRSLDYMMVAFTTRSSAASLPIALQVAEQKRNDPGSPGSRSPWFGDEPGHLRSVAHSGHVHANLRPHHVEQ